MVYLDQSLHTYVLSDCLATGMQNGDEALPSSILACRGNLVKVHITLELNHVF